MNRAKTLILITATAMPWYALFSKVIVFYFFLGFIAVDIPVIGNLVLAVLILAVLPLAVDLLLISPALTIWTAVKRGQTPTPVVIAQMVNMIIITIFCIASVIPAAALAADYVGSDLLYSAGMLGNALVLSAGTVCAIISLRNLGRMRRKQNCRPKHHKHAPTPVLNGSPAHAGIDPEPRGVVIVVDQVPPHTRG